MKRLKEHFFQKKNYCYSRYDGYFEHTRENGEVMLLHIVMTTKYNNEDVDVYLFTKDKGFTNIANFWNIEGLTEMYQWDKGEKFVKVVGKNLNVIEEWLDIVFH